VTQQRLWLAFALLAGAAFAIQISLPQDVEGSPETSWDTAPRGHAGLLELLVRFDATPGRWLTGLSLPPTDETIWYIAPEDVCEPAESDLDSEAVPGPFRFVTLPWIEAGGTAVVWLSRPPLPSEVEEESVEEGEEGEEGDYETISMRASPVSSERGEVSDAEDEEKIREEWRESVEDARSSLHEGRSEICEAIAGARLPPRRLAGLEEGELPRQGRFAPVVFSLGRAVERREDFDYDATRVLPGSTLAFFELGHPEASAGWRPIWVEADDFTPFALERSIGLGRLVVVADARVLTNARLADVDSAPFVFDWVEQYGRPWIDEHAHGAVPESGTFRYLARSPAWAAMLGLVGVGVLVIWRGHAWPMRRVVEADPEAPTLSTFVDSVALLYSRTRDHERVFERYRGLCLERIRRALGLAAGTPAEIVVASLRAREAGWSELRETGLGDLLTRNVPIADAEELVRAAARLDALVAVVRAGRAEGRGAASVGSGDAGVKPAQDAETRGRS
jgi:hypothetical protein